MRRWAVLATVLVSALLAPGLAACSGGSSNDPDVHPVTTVADTVPDSVEAGTAVLVLAGKAHEFTVTCGTDPTTTTAPGVTTEFEMRGTGTTDGAGESLLVLRQETQGVTATTTDTITYASPTRTLEAQRVAFSGTYVDLRESGVTAPLLDIQDAEVSADGVFGPPGSTTSSSLLAPGQLVATCPA
jgi:hypothetical protein